MTRSTSAGRRARRRSASGTSPRPASRAGARWTMADLIRTFRLLNAGQRTAAVGAVLLAVSTFGPFSFVEAAELLIALGVLALLRARAQGRRFHLPFGDGTAIAAAGAWAAALIVVRLFDRPLGQNLLALACAAILILAGGREKAKRPPDDLPAEHQTPPIRRRPRPPARRRRASAAASPAPSANEPNFSPAAVVNTWPYSDGSTTHWRTANWAASVGPSTAETTAIRASSTGSE